MTGYIKLHRKMQDWEWYDDVNVKVVFLHLLLTANFKATKWHGIDLEAGEVVIGRVKLAAELGLSESQVRTAFKKLKSTGEIATKNADKCTIVTLCNWALYQSGENETSNQSPEESPEESPEDDQQIATKSPANRHSVRKKELKNLRREEGGGNNNVSGHNTQSAANNNSQAETTTILLPSALYDADYAAVNTAMVARTGRAFANPTHSEQCARWIEDMGVDLVLYAVQQGAKRCPGECNWPYINGVLKGWERAGLTTPALVEAHEKRRKEQKARSSTPRAAPGQSVPDYDDAENAMARYLAEHGEKP